MPRSHSSSNLESTVMNDLRNINTGLGVTDRSHHNEYNLTGNGVLNQHYGAVYNQTTNHISHQAIQPKSPLFPRCPAPSPNYTPREVIESHMHSYFFAGSRGLKRYVLCGLGGTGKSEIGLAFVDKYCYSQEPGNKRFPEALWIDATTDETIEESFKDIGLSMGVGSGVTDVLRWLASHISNWIIVFNNADNPKMDMTKYFPKCSHGNILITTRNHHARRYGVGFGSDYEVSEMTADEALILFRKHARIFDDANPLIETAKVLIEEVGRFALAVTQAGAFISASQCSLNHYRNLYRNQRQELLRQHEDMLATHDYQYRSLHTTWMISYARLSDPAKELVQVFACVHYEGIKEVMFSETCNGGMDDFELECGPLFTESEKAGLARLRKLRESLSTNGRWDVMKFRRLISELQSYSLVAFDPEAGTCGMHPLVHEWAGNVWSVEERMVLRQSTILLLGSSLIGFRTADELAFCRALTSHIDRVFQGVNPRTSACGGRFGRAYSKAGRWYDTVIHQELFKERCMRVLGEGRPSTLASMNNLASTFLKLGRTGEAEKLQLRVIKACKRISGTEHPHMLTAMSNLASTYSKLGRHHEAEKLELQVVEARKRVSGAEHPSTLTSMSNLASTYSKLGRPDEAAKLQLQVVEARKRVLGPEHPSTLTSMNSLALVYSKLGRFIDAEKIQLQVVEARERILGADHPSTLTSMNNLALTYSKLGQSNKAMKLETRVVEARKRVLGAKHPDTLISTRNLASIYRDQEVAEVEELAQQTPLVPLRAFDVDHSTTLSPSILPFQTETEETHNLSFFLCCLSSGRSRR